MVVLLTCLFFAWLDLLQMQAGLVPGSYVGMGNFGTGCFGPGEGITLGNFVQHWYCYIQFGPMH